MLWHLWRPLHLRAATSAKCASAPLRMLTISRTLRKDASRIRTAKAAEAYSEPFDIMRKPISKGTYVSLAGTMGCVVTLSFLSTVLPFAFVERKEEGDSPQELDAKVADMMKHNSRKKYQIYALKGLFNVISLAAVIRFVGLNFYRVTRLRMANPVGVERSVKAMTPESALIVDTVASDWHLSRPRLGTVQEFDLLGPVVMDHNKRLPHHPPRSTDFEIKSRRKASKTSLMDWFHRIVFLGWTRERLSKRSLWDYDVKSWKLWQVAPLMNVNDLFMYRLPVRFQNDSEQFWVDKGTFEAGLLLYGNFSERLRRL